MNSEDTDLSRIRAMNAVNAVLLLTLVWTFTAVCQAEADDDDDDSVICEDVTGAVGAEVTLTCSVSQSLKCTKRCITLYKFQDPEGDSGICREKFPHDSCEQRNSFTCRFTPTTAMTRQFRFFVQTPCDRKTSGFTVIITGPIKPEIDTKSLGKNEPIAPDIVSEDHPDMKEPSKSEHEHEKPSHGFKVAVIAAIISGFIIVIVPVVYKITQNYKQKRRFLQNRPETVI